MPKKIYYESHKLPLTEFVSERFADNCEEGALHFGVDWLRANESAVLVATRRGLDVSRPALKEFMTALILTVLKRTKNLE